MFKAKYPAFFSVALFKSTQKTLVGISKSFKDKRLRRQFILIVLSIVSQGSTLLQEANQIVNGRVGSVVANLSNFLKSDSWDLELLARIHQSFLKDKIPKSLFIILDFTALVKTGKKFEYLGQVYDGRDGQVKNGFDLLLALGVNQDNTKEQLVLDHQLVSSKHPQAKTENKVITGLVKKLVNLCKKARIKLKKVIFIGDRGFDRKYIVKGFLKEKAYFVVRAKDKNITLKDGTKTKLYQLKPGIYSKVYLDSWKLALNVVVVKAREKKDDEKEETMVLLTNLPKKN